MRLYPVRAAVALEVDRPGRIGGVGGDDLGEIFEGRAVIGHVRHPETRHVEREHVETRCSERRHHGLELRRGERRLMQQYERLSRVAVRGTPRTATIVDLTRRPVEITAANDNP